MCSSIYSMDCVCLAARHQMNGLSRKPYARTKQRYVRSAIDNYCLRIYPRIAYSLAIFRSPSTALRERATTGSGDGGLFFPDRSYYSGGDESRNRVRLVLVRKHDLAFIRLADIEDHCQTRIARTIASTYRLDRAKITTVACTFPIALFLHQS